MQPAALLTLPDRSGPLRNEISPLIAAGLYLTGLPALAGDDDVRTRPLPVADQHAEFFEARIRPILAEHCYSCHGPKKQQSGLRLDSREGLLKGADSGPVVVPGQPEESPLIEAIRHDRTIKMPPKSKLPAQAIVDLTTWVRMGVPWPENIQKRRAAPGKGARTGSSHRKSLGVSADQGFAASDGQECRLAPDLG